MDLIHTSTIETLLISTIFSASLSTKSSNSKNAFPINDNVIPAPVEEHSVETVVDHEVDKDGLISMVGELTKDLHCLQHEVKQLKEQPSHDSNFNQAVHYIKYGIILIIS